MRVLDNTDPGVPYSVLSITMNEGVITVKHFDMIDGVCACVCVCVRERERERTGIQLAFEPKTPFFWDSFTVSHTRHLALLCISIISVDYGAEEVGRDHTCIFNERVTGPLLWEFP